MIGLAADWDKRQDMQRQNMQKKWRFLWLQKTVILLLLSLLLQASLQASLHAKQNTSSTFLSSSSLVKSLAEYNPQLRQAGIVLRVQQGRQNAAASPFDWRLESGSDLRQTVTPNPLTPTELRHRTSFEIYAQMSRMLRTGTQLSLRAGQSFTEYPLYRDIGFPSSLQLTIPGAAIGPDADDISFPVQIRSNAPQGPATVNTWGASLDFSLVQPLLRGAAKAVIDAADQRSRHDFNLAKLAQQQTAQSVLAQTLGLALQLSLQQTDHALRIASRNLARDQLVQTRAMIAAGRQPRIAELQIRQTIAQREEASLSAERSLHELDIKLRRSLGMKLLPEQAVLRPQLLQITLPNQRTLQQWLQRAEGRNLKIMHAQQALAKSKFQLRVAKDQLLPRLDASAGVGSMAQDVDGLAVWPQLLSSQDGFNWHVGLSFAMPLENRQARGQVEAAQLDVERAQADLDEARAALSEELSLALHDLKLARERIRVGRISRNLAARSAEGESERHALGLATTFELLSAQEKLREAEFALQKARSDVSLAQIRLLAASGELLVYYGLSL